MAINENIDRNVKVRDVLMVSELDMCGFCSDLLLRILAMRRNMPNEPNIVILSQSAWNKERSSQKESNIKTFINRHFHGTSKSGNRLIMYIRYGK